MVNFAKKSGLDWLQMTDFGHFACFPIFSPKMRLRLTWNGQFHLIHNFSHILPPKRLIFGEISKTFIPHRGGAHQQILSFSTFSNYFTLKQLKMTHSGEFCQKKWLRLAPNGQFWLFCRFFHLFPQNEAQNGQFQLIHNFSHLLPPKHLIFGEISKFSFLGGGSTSTDFLSFSTFSNCFTPKWLKMTHNGEFCQKSGLDWLQMTNFGHFACFPIFSPKMRLRLTWNGQFHLIHNFSHILPPKRSFLEKSQKLSFLMGGGGHISKF